MTWELWSSDLFDRSAEPREEDSGTELFLGAESFWKRTLEDGTLEDGTPSFTHFHVRLPDSLRVDLPEHPTRREALHKLRAWRRAPDLIAALGAFHATQFDRSGCVAIYEAALVAADAEALCAFLREKARPPASTISEDCLVVVHALAKVLAAELGHPIDVGQIAAAEAGSGIVFGDQSRPHIMLSAAPGPEAKEEGASRWELSVRGLTEDGAPRRFSVLVEDDADGTRRQTIATDHGSALGDRLRGGLRERLARQ